MLYAGRLYIPHLLPEEASMNEKYDIQLTEDLAKKEHTRLSRKKLLFHANTA